MSEAIARIYADHRNVASLLRLLEHESRQLEQGEFTDYKLISDIMNYFVNYPDIYHHPLEDAIFAVLKNKDPNVADDVDKISAEHMTMVRDSQKILDDVTRIMGGDVVQRDDIVRELQEYVERYWRHMSAEEQTLLQKAESELDDDDWNAVDADSVRHEDPLFGKALKDEYQTLFQNILAQSDAGKG